ncbi:hypothetical protein Lesp02_63720 [Lentzea sp. NBRC 105346]|uniref:hypothetical protein n=1 Tax=Lentzea sp. NBRC 105346 TaxID=3032205 RepID=UPI0024A3620A|nr:hypothetical protein [Lentzea sp. NBRC 105346]GLZ34185.1 hypothetical protein Lesp02_63720 [Lentzea sp. NBRC 105346]
MPADKHPEHPNPEIPDQTPLSRRDRRAAKHGGGGKIPVQNRGGRSGPVVAPRQYAVRRRG